MKEKTNKYGVDMSKSEAYWLDCSGMYHRYVLKRAYKECGCEKNDDCCCDDECFDGWGDKAQEASYHTQKRRRLLLLKR